MKIVDVLIPFHNDSDGFRKTIMSVRRQTLAQQLRIVVVDDGSSGDHAANVGSMLEQSGLEYTLKRNVQNRGRPYTRNVLLDCMESDFVAWLDSGDEWFPDKIERQLASLDQAGVDKDTDDCWATCGYEWREDGVEPQRITQKTDGDITKALLKGKELRAYLWTVLAPKVAMRRVGYFDADLPRLQDLDFFLRFASAGGRLVQPDVTMPLCAYNKEHTGRSASEINAAYDRIFLKHDRIYRQYGRRFRVECQRRAKKNCARFAVANGEVQLAKSLNRQRNAITWRFLLGLS